MGSPVEFRQFMPVFTLDHAKAGINPMRQNINGQVFMFAPPVLQYRYVEVIHENGVKKRVWSEWETTGFVREGIDEGPIEDAGSPIES
jgi:hypothetical protein